MKWKSSQPGWILETNNWFCWKLKSFDDSVNPIKSKIKRLSSESKTELIKNTKIANIKEKSNDE